MARHNPHSGVGLAIALADAWRLLVGEMLNAVHTPSRCRWARLGYERSGVPESGQPERLWGCVRESAARRLLGDADCANCPFWVPEGPEDEGRKLPGLRWLQCE